MNAGSSLLINGLDAILQAGIGLLVLGFYHPLLLLFDAVLIGAIAFILFGLLPGRSQWLWPPCAMLAADCPRTL